MGVIRQRRTTQLQSVGVSRIQTGEADAAMAIANAADNLTGIVTRQMQKVAQEKGIDYAEAVAAENLRAFDENGEPIALRVPSGFGTEGARVYREVINRKYARLVDEDMRLAGAEYAVKYPDPQQFTDQFSNYIANYADGAEGRYKVQAEEAGTAQLTSFVTNLKASQQRGATDSAASESLLQAYNALDALNKVHKLGIITEENETIAKELAIAADTAITKATNNLTDFRARAQATEKPKPEPTKPEAPKPEPQRTEPVDTAPKRQPEEPAKPEVSSPVTPKPQKKKEKKPVETSNGQLPQE